MARPTATPRVPLPARAWIDVLVLTALAVFGILGFAPAFNDSAYLIAGIGGLLVGTAAGVLAGYLRLNAIFTAIVAAGAYFVFGSALAMPAQATFLVLPSLKTLSGLAIGAVFGWSDIVTLTTPVAAPDYIGVLPYVAGWGVGMVSATIASRWFARHHRTPGPAALALIAPTAVYAASVLLGTEQPYFGDARGVAFAVLALVWMSWRVTDGGGAPAAAARTVLRRKLVGVAAIAAFAVVGGTLIGAAAAPPAASRFVLRDNVQPPFDPLIYGSPLAAFRQYSKDISGDVLFTIDGLQKDDRIRIATMDAYTGQVWNVTSPVGSNAATGIFGLVGQTLPVPPLATVGTTDQITVTVDKYSDVWLPSVGYPRSVSFGAQAPDSTALRYNAATGILIDTDHLTTGQRYTVSIERQTIPSADALSKVGVANIPFAHPENVPELVGSTATELAGSATDPYEKLVAIQKGLIAAGQLSHGKASEPPSRAGHGADRMKLLLQSTPMVGDQEQFASVFALMAESLGYPARVVLGYQPASSSGTVTVTGQDVTAWVEVAFDGVGWIPFDVTPIKSDAPQTQTSKPQTLDLPQVRQPPRSNNQQDDAVSATEVKNDVKKDPPFTIPGWVVGTALAIGIPLALYFLPALVIGGFKRRRRRRRLTDPVADVRAAGAWSQLVDTYAELGYQASRRATRVQLALSFEQQFRDELEARQRERSDAAQRADNKATRAAAKSAAKLASSSPKSAALAGLSTILEATVVRAKDASTWRPGVANDDDPLPVLPGLRELAVASDAAVFSGELVDDGEIERLWSESDAAASAARKSVSWFRRRLSVFRFRGSRDVAGDLAARLGDLSRARPRLKEATRGAS